MKKTVKTLPPLDGVRMLWMEPRSDNEKQTIYEMPIVQSSPQVAKATARLKDPLALYEYWGDHIDSLSLHDQIALLQKSLLLDPTSALAWYALACTYELERQDWYAATNAWNHVIFLQPTSATAWISLSQLWAGRGMHVKAQECYAEFEKLEKKHAGKKSNLSPNKPKGLLAKFIDSIF